MKLQFSENHPFKEEAKINIFFQQRLYSASILKALWSKLILDKIFFEKYLILVVGRFKAVSIVETLICLSSQKSLFLLVFFSNILQFYYRSIMFRENVADMFTEKLKKVVSEWRLYFLTFHSPGVHFQQISCLCIILDAC
jgi:hypothetical protein